VAPPPPAPPIALPDHLTWYQPMADPTPDSDDPGLPMAPSMGVCHLPDSSRSPG
jgi:hypothetical protein